MTFKHAYIAPRDTDATRSAAHHASVLADAPEGATICDECEGYGFAADGFAEDPHDDCHKCEFCAGEGWNEADHVWHASSRWVACPDLIDAVARDIYEGGRRSVFAFAGECAA